MTAVLQAHGLGKKYGRRWALTDCDLEVPAGHVVGLVGPMITSQRLKASVKSRVISRRTFCAWM